VVLASVALAMWGVLIVAFVTAKPENGANIGAGILGLVAIALSVVAESFLIASTDRGVWKTVGTVAICAWALVLGASSGDLLTGLALRLLGLIPVGPLVVCHMLLRRGWRGQGHSVMRSP
jgi:hypothetical protein